ncbi:putative leucine-rich repeat receptor-like serine/threonine-protein kinase isoform X1 [Cinnamomum micranthum f. kanehirae]|uniref:Putative leucine-rich repeat receptor-like serine/threonine-protein kinase isoform X1 n=1 Tax=Cinnamomum micranthum f. kanehirae TaxID=337451 RepID=A0A443PZS1_9MAGN|nr:putative leucine-rich repeat receptor-like serine/threonine-protein kinase isoform X1 [Cinnamomum micranthum f. kanehirae]
MDDGIQYDKYRITIDNISRLSMPNPKLYATARLAPSSLSYYGFCLGNGNYNVTLHFAEILFTDDKTYGSLGKRVFDVYVQETLVLKDFNIEKEAKGSGNACVRSFIANVTGNTLEIRFYWAGKGTESLPNRGTYGPLISAISVEPGLLRTDISIFLLFAVYLCFSTLT